MSRNRLNLRQFTTFYVLPILKIFGRRIQAKSGKISIFHILESLPKPGIGEVLRPSLSHVSLLHVSTIPLQEKKNPISHAPSFLSLKQVRIFWPFVPSGGVGQGHHHEVVGILKPLGFGIIWSSIPFKYVLTTIKLLSLHTHLKQCPGRTGI
jgi:hypothetical protein